MVNCEFEQSIYSAITDVTTIDFFENYRIMQI